jgi:hypothetical protein
MATTRIQKQLSMTKEALRMLAQLAKADQTSQSHKVRQLILDEYRRRYNGQQPEPSQ